jgi:uncharacterized Rossmann fold enzyme
MIVGNVQYIGKALFRDVVYPDCIKKVHKNEWVIIALNKCKELIDTGDFIPDEETQKMLDQFSGTMRNKKVVDGMLKGKRCFIIGGGASLKGFDFSQLDGEFTIAVNHSVIYYPKASACIFLDAVFLDKNDNEARKFLNSYKGMIFCSFRTQYHKDNLNAIPFYVNNDRVQAQFSRGLWGSRLTGMAAISLAITMGAEKIYLLGYDLNKNAIDIHFYDSDSKSKYANDKGYKGERLSTHIAMFKHFDYYKDRIINLNPKTSIPFFKVKRIEDVLNELDYNSSPAREQGVAV